MMLGMGVNRPPTHASVRFSFSVTEVSLGVDVLVLPLPP